MKNRLRLAAFAAAALAGCARHDAGAGFSGYAEAEFVYLAPSTAGTLKSLAVQRGDRVHAGQTLYTLDADAQVLAREAAAARSLSAEKQADDLRHGKRPSELDAIRAQLAQARAALANSSAALERNQRLVAQGFVAPQTQDALVATRASDSARVRELQANLATAELAARRDQIAAAAAAAQGTRADLGLARWQEQQMQRQAPGDAFVYDVMYRVGEWVPAGAPVIALLPPGAVKLRFFVPEPALAGVSVGQTVAVSCDGCAAGLSARVDYVSPQAEYTPPVIYSDASRAKLVFMVEAQPQNGAALKPGQPVEVRLNAPS